MGKTTWARLMFVLLLLLPLVAFFLLPGPHAGASLAWFWVALLLCWLLVFAVMRKRHGKSEGNTVPKTTPDEPKPKV